ncbi:MAG: AAA family ATPase [Deltaproteobacteria bacterium]|jgi:hypothetical protein|nr:AAA family ATPase [Deltaproteobacteria bacterium]
MEDHLKPLELEEESFEALIGQGAVYVDKTDLILELIKKRGPFFLSRPRRFGKSLLLDTIKQVFDGRRELFAGLKIEKLAPNFNWAQTPVIRINMAGTNIVPAEFGDDLLALIKSNAKNHRVEIETTNFYSAFISLVTELSTRHTDSAKPADNLAKLGPGNIVLLIDEYDYPFHRYLGDPAVIEQTRLTLYGFYSAIKSLILNFRFILITGITKFRQLSLFSALNNFRDITFEPRFSTICGFTRQEIESSFDRHLASVLSAQKNVGLLPHHWKSSDIIGEIANWYDGYSWDGENKVFNPFAIKSFLEFGAFDDYWYKSGVPMLTAMLESFTGNFFTIFDKNLSVSDSTTVNDTQNICNKAFLLQAGYLTVDSVSGYGKDRIYRLKVPNNEVKDAIELELKSKFSNFIYNLRYGNKSHGPHALFTDIRSLLQSAMWSRNSQESEMCLGSIFSGISKDLYRQGGEKYYNIILQILFKYGGAILDGDIFKAMSQLLSDAGRSDLVIEVQEGGELRGYIVVELKFIPEQGGWDIYENEPSAGNASPYHEYPEPSGQTFQQSRPISVTGLIEQGRISEPLKRRLEREAEDAFEQIKRKHYAKFLFISGKPILAAAVVVYRTSTVLVRFKDVVWMAENQDVPKVGIIQLPVPVDYATDI